jgi:hypothetical protein
MYVKTNVIVFQDRHHNVFGIKLTNNVQYHGQFIDMENITQRDQRKHAPITNKLSVTIHVMLEEIYITYISEQSILCLCTLLVSLMPNTL